MNELFSEDQVIATVSRLTRKQLVTFVEAEIVSPHRSGKTVTYRQVDIARIELLCELSEDFDLNTDALGVIISLVDQLHDARAELRAVLEVLQRQPTELRHQVGKALRATRIQAGDKQL